MRALLVSLTCVAAAGLALAQDLTVWTPLQGGAEDWLHEEVAGFESGFGLDVEVVRLDLPELQRRMLLAEDEDAADVLAGIPHDAVATMAAAGVLADVGAYTTGAYLEDLSASARIAFTRDDALLGFPTFAEGPALLYNRALLPEPPETYPELLETARRLTDEGRFGFLADVGNFYYAYAWLATHGGYVFAWEDGRYRPDDVGLANPGARRGAEALRALRFEHDLVPEELTYAEAHRRFLQGSLGMFYTGPWAWRQARQAGVDVGVAPMPPLADGTPWSGFMTVHGVLLNRYGESPRDAANLAKWITRSDAQVRLARAEQRIPTSTAALERLGEDPLAAGFGEALRHAQPIPDVREMGAVWGSMSQALDTLLSDPDADVAAVLRRAVEAIRGG